MRIFKHPIKKLTLLTAFGGGYVLGARAGRERYEQIKQTATQVKDDPRVQEAASRAEDLVRETATRVTEDPRVKDVVSRAEDIVRDAGLHTSDSDAGPTSDADASLPIGDDTVNPLLADEHIGLEEEIVYTSGPDIEESIDQLADLDSGEQQITDDRRDRRDDA